MVEAWMYLRKSRAEEEEIRRARARGEALDVLWKQRAMLLSTAERDGVSVPEEHIYTEIGSGEHLSTRPEFQRLLDVWKALTPLPTGHRRVAFVAESDRLSRGILTERGEVQDALIRARIQVRTPHELIDLERPAQRLLHEVKGSLAHHFLLEFKQKVADSRLEMTKKAMILTGRKRFGYVWSKDQQTLLPHPEEFPILQAWCEEAIHTSTHALAQRYGVHQSKICYALRNPATCGRPHKRFWGSSNRPSDEGEWLAPLQEATYPGACTYEQWLRIQQVLDDRRETREKVGHVENGWCRDVVRFVAYPEQRVRLASVDNKKFKTPSYLAPGVKPAPYIPRDVVHEAAACAIGRLAGNSRILAQMAALDAPAPDRAAPDPGKELAKKRRVLDGLLEKELLADTQEERASIERVRKATLAAIAQLEREALQPKVDLDTVAARHAICWLSAASGYWEEVWAEATGAEKRTIINGLLRRVWAEVVPAKCVRDYERRVAGIEYVPCVEGILSL